MRKRHKTEQTKRKRKKERERRGGAKKKKWEVSKLGSKPHMMDLRTNSNDKTCDN